MASLSSRAHIGTHGAFYVYNYSSFKGDPRQLLLKHFDVFFYISNFGTIRLMFKYLNQQVNISMLKKYCVKPVISCERYGQDVLLDICISSDNGGGWIEGEGLLPDLLPLYEEIKSGDYRFLSLVLDVNDKLSGSSKGLDAAIKNASLLPLAQQAFLDCLVIRMVIFKEMISKTSFLYYTSSCEK